MAYESYALNDPLPPSRKVRLDPVRDRFTRTGREPWDANDREVNHGCKTSWCLVPHIHILWWYMVMFVSMCGVNYGSRSSRSPDSARPSASSVALRMTGIVRSRRSSPGVRGPQRQQEEGAQCGEMSTTDPGQALKGTLSNSESMRKLWKNSRQSTC